ncbi:hypothetical protein Adt_10417 [Abeliophyllum distichum]|uniref:Uncharacterized protein n=1 Tax=Abeliophyllum distichum TaxID=126358 RepID=A0ABD1ULL2_9LAMI
MCGTRRCVCTKEGSDVWSSRARSECVERAEFKRKNEELEIKRRKNETSQGLEAKMGSSRVKKKTKRGQIRLKKKSERYILEHTSGSSARHAQLSASSVWSPGIGAAAPSGLQQAISGVIFYCFREKFGTSWLEFLGQ